MMRKNIALGIMAAGVLCLSGCSALSGLTGTTSTNPTGSTGPTVATTVLGVSVPLHSTVASNCAAGDTNSCAQQANIVSFCAATATIQEAHKACVGAGW